MLVTIAASVVGLGLLLLWLGYPGTEIYITIVVGVMVLFYDLFRSVYVQIRAQDLR